MKKFFCICLATALMFSLCSCVSRQNEDDIQNTETSSAYSEITASPVISLSADTEEAAPGDTVNITVNISDAPLVACYEISVFADERLIYIDSEECDKSEMINEGTYKETEKPYFYMSGISLTACDLIDNDVFVITYTVDEDAASGEELSLTVSTSSFMLATDETGNDTQEVFNKTTCKDVSVKVK